MISFNFAKYKKYKEYYMDDEIEIDDKLLLDIQKDLKKILEDSGKGLLIICVILGMYLYISWACKGCI